MKNNNKLVCDLSDHLTHEEGYVKSGLSSDYFDGGIFFNKDPIPYTHGIYEMFVDSYGNEHSVQIGYEMKECQLKDEYFKIIKDDEGDSISSINCPIRLSEIGFQFNLKRYELIGWFRGDSGLNIFRHITRDKDNSAPAWAYISHWENQEAMESIGYAPFYEHCYGKYECNYIPDRLFFNYANREEAIKRVFCGVIGTYNRKINPFVDFDYVNATDRELVRFMNDRFKKRLKYETFLRTHEYLLT